MSEQTLNPFALVSSTEVYANPWIQVREDRVIRPGGKPGLFGVVTMRPGSTILALDKDLNAYCVREYKYAVARETLEVVSGGLDATESPLDAAKRELKEELGLVAGQLVDLGVVDPFTTVINSPNYIFLALDVTEGERAPDEGEIIHTVKIPFTELVAKVQVSEITHGATCVLILKAERYLRHQGLLS